MIKHVYYFTSLKKSVMENYRKRDFLKVERLCDSTASSDVSIKDI